MSPYKQVNGMKTILCKYEYDTILVGMIPNLFLLKKTVAQYINKKSVKGYRKLSQRIITLKTVRSKLESLGIIVNLERLMSNEASYELSYLDKTLLMIIDT